MEIYRSNDGKVTKYVHDDGSETSIKHPIAKDCGGKYGNVRNKFNVFISYSVGCNIRCKFCYLTAKRFPYTKLTSRQIVNNVIDAINDQVNVYPHFKDFYVKLSWMGMGDALLDFHKTIDVTDMIIRRLMANNVCKGIDGIDIGTTLPKTADIGALLTYLEIFHALMMDFPINPLRTAESPFRFFYSLHSAFNETRQSLIPNTHEISPAFQILNRIPNKWGKVILHHMFLDGVNDEEYQISELIRLMKFVRRWKPYQLRILRFNTCTNSKYIESKNFNEIIKRLHKNLNNLKIQASPGSEVKAACGQFLLSQMKDIK